MGPYRLNIRYESPAVVAVFPEYPPSRVPCRGGVHLLTLGTPCLPGSAIPLSFAASPEAFPVGGFLPFFGAYWAIQAVMVSDIVGSAERAGLWEGHSVPHWSAMALAIPGKVRLRFFHRSGTGGSRWTLFILPSTIFVGVNFGRFFSHRQVAFVSP